MSEDLKPMPPQVKPGHETSEFVLARMVVWISMVLAVLGGLTEVLSIVGKALPQGGAVGKVMMIIGTLSAVLTSVAYTLNRLALKKAALLKPALSIDEATQELTK
jgi:hypothetical protein